MKLNGSAVGLSAVVLAVLRAAASIPHAANVSTIWLVVEWGLALFPDCVKNCYRLEF